MSYDVIIIGAGAAGLAAARDLAGSGRKICLLEARQRVGGRVFSLHLPPLPLPIELGAEFIHGASETTFGIVHAAGLAAAELPDTHWWARGGRWTLVEDYWGEIDEVRAKIGPRKRDVSFAEFLRTRRGLTARQKELARTFVEGYHASYAERISTAVLRTADGEQEQPGGNRQFRLAGGQNGIIDFLRAGLHPDHAEVRLGTVATAVTWSEGRVSVTCRSAQTRYEETLRARALLLTLPIGVWKAAQEQDGAVRFDPPLREKQRALDLIEPGHVVKIALRFREAFWASPEFTRARTASRQWQRGLPLNFIHLAGQPLPTWWTSAPFLAPILTGWAGGPAADTLLAEGEEAILDRALESRRGGRSRAPASTRRWSPRSGTTGSATPSAAAPTRTPPSAARTPTHSWPARSATRSSSRERPLAATRPARLQARSRAGEERRGRSCAELSSCWLVACCWLLVAGYSGSCCRVVMLSSCLRINV